MISSDGIRGLVHREPERLAKYRRAFNMSALGRRGPDSEALRRGAYLRADVRDVVAPVGRLVRVSRR